MKKGILFLLIFTNATLFAQNEDFASDRPGLSDSPDLIDKNSWQISTGFDISNYNHYQLYQISTNTLKYGISDRFEARMDFGIQYDPEQKIYGTSGPSFGLKYLMLKQNKLIPKTAIIVEYYTPPFASSQQASGLATELVFSHEFKNGNSLYHNVGIDWVDVKGKPTLNNLSGFSYEVNETISLFIEVYMYHTPGLKTNYVSDLGITYQLNKKLQLDFAFGSDLVVPKGNLYFDGGVSYNF